MFKFIGISLILAVIQLSESSPVYQFLPHREGYVPVYIRLGDTPLDEINPDLALAFHESAIATRNVNDLEEQMQNDAPVEDLSNSEEDTDEKITISKGSISDEEAGEEEEVKPQEPVKQSKPETPVSVDEPDSDEKIEIPQKDSPVSDNKSDEEVDSEEETDLTQLTKDDDSDEIVESSSATNKSSPDDSLEATKSRRTVAPPPPPAKKEVSSEEVDDDVTEKKTSTSYENKSSEEVDK